MMEWLREQAMPYRPNRRRRRTVAFVWGMAAGLGLALLLVKLVGCGAPLLRTDAYSDLRGLSAREQLERMEGLYDSEAE
jgi:hypothetical protein